MRAMKAAADLAKRHDRQPTTPRGQAKPNAKSKAKAKAPRKKESTIAADNLKSADDWDWTLGAASWGTILWTYKVIGLVPALGLIGIRVATRLKVAEKITSAITTGT